MLASLWLAKDGSALSFGERSDFYEILFQLYVVTAV
jgi:hypothetical protein